MSLGSAASTVTIELPNGFLPEIAGTIEGFAAELRLAAAIQWCRAGRVSQGRGAEVAGLTRAGFLEALHRAEVSASRVGVAELMEDVDRAAAPDRRAEGLPSPPKFAPLGGVTQVAGLGPLDLPKGDRSP